MTLSGTVRQAEYREAAANQQGIKGFHKLVLSPTDHPAGLTFVDCLELPAGFPTGERLNAEVDIVGISYKRWAYAAQDGIRTAPLLLAKTVTWKNAPGTAVVESTDWTMAIVGGLVAGVVGLVAVAWMCRRPSPTFRLPSQRNGADVLPHDVLQQLAAIEAGNSEVGPSSPRSDAASEALTQPPYLSEDRQT